MEGLTLIQKGDVEFERTSARPGERVWIAVSNPSGEARADIGILVNSEGISIDVFPFNESDDPDGDGPIISPWLLWSDIEEALDLKRSIVEASCE